MEKKKNIDISSKQVKAQKIVVNTKKDFKTTLDAFLKVNNKEIKKK